MPEASIDQTFFSDVADALNIKETAFVEKDYYAIQLLKLIHGRSIPNFKFIFSGGTCLAKAYQNTQRMSEDIDIKFSDHTGFNTRASRKKLNKHLTDIIQQTPLFSIQKTQVHDQYCTQIFEIKYPNSFHHAALKAILKLELVQSPLYEPINKKSVCSMYNKVMQLPPEIDSIDCVNAESIAAEKLFALLWRTSALKLRSLLEDDPALVRHVYDIHLLLAAKQELNFTLLKEIFILSLNDHAKRYHNKHPEFLHNPKTVLKHGLENLISDFIHQQRYEQFLLPLTYSQQPPSWNDSLNSLQILFRTLDE